MKKTLILLSFIIALLFLGYGCDDNKKEKKVDTPIEVRADDKGIAFEVFQRIPKEELYEKFQTKDYTCPDDCHRHFGDSEGNNSDASLYMDGGGNHLFTVDCFPLKNGGWLTLLVNEGCFEGCDHVVKTYIYKEGVLNIANGMLPLPTMEEMVAYPFLLYGIRDDEINNFKSDWNDRLLYYVQGGDTLKVMVETLNYDDRFMNVLSARKYVWNGESFVPILNNEAKDYPLIEFDGLDGLHLNDSMPEELPGLSRHYEGEVLAFNRDGEPYIKLYPDGAGKIQTIEVFAKDLTYHGDKIGDTLNRLYKGKDRNRAYYKDGEFVVTEERDYTENRIDFVGPKEAIVGSFVEGEIANPKFKSDATVQYIRIYKPHHWENDTCDMQALTAAMDEAGMGGNYPECLKAYYDINSLYYFRELYNQRCEGYCDVFEYYLHCYPLKSGGFKVYVTTDWEPGDDEDDVDAGYSLVEAFIYKDGKVTEAEVEPGMNDFETNVGGFRFAKVTSVSFNENTMEMAFKDESNKEYRIEFTWDGTTMRKTYEGLIDF